MEKRDFKNFGLTNRTQAFTCRLHQHVQRIGGSESKSLYRRPTLNRIPRDRLRYQRQLVDTQSAFSIVHMKLVDPLYGAFELPEYLWELLLTPEVRRLSQVRLLNTPSPTLAAIGEMRRFSHTIGVMRLGLLSPLARYSEAERRAFWAVCLLHDVGTPPFAHLFEYQLQDNDSSWDHEQVGVRVLNRNASPENSSLQIYSGLPAQFGQTAALFEVDTELIRDIVEKRHALSALLFGSLDLDNLDNVVRMAWALGMAPDGSIASDLAGKLAITSDGTLSLPRSAEFRVAEWLSLRSRVYTTLNYDTVAIALQAALSVAISRALACGDLTRDDWNLTDEDFLLRIRRCKVAKADFAKDYLRHPMKAVFMFRLAGTAEQLHLTSRAAAVRRSQRVLEKEFLSQKTLAYAIVDRRTFGRQLTFCDPLTRKKWSIGEDTSSLLLYGFVRSHNSVSPTKANRVAKSILKDIPRAQDRLLWSWVAGDEESSNAQQSIAFSSNRD